MVYVDFSFRNQNFENLETALILTLAKFNVSEFRMEEEHLWRLLLLILKRKYTLLLLMFKTELIYHLGTKLVLKKTQGNVTITMKLKM